MADKPSGKLPEEMERDSREFGRRVLELGRELKLPSSQVFYVFGLIGKASAESCGRKERGMATLAVLESFTSGLGIDLAMQRVTPEEAAQIEAQIEADRSTKQ